MFVNILSRMVPPHLNICWPSLPWWCFFRCESTELCKEHKGTKPQKYIFKKINKTSVFYIACCVLLHWSLQESSFKELKRLSGEDLFLLSVVSKSVFHYSLQPLHQNSDGLCEQQRERGVCSQHGAPYLSGAGQSHYGLWWDPASALSGHLLLGESLFQPHSSGPGVCFPKP